VAEGEKSGMSLAIADIENIRSGILDEKARCSGSAPRRTIRNRAVRRPS